MKQASKHNRTRATSGVLGVSAPRKAAQAVVAFALAFCLFPVQGIAYAADAAQGGNVQVFTLGQDSSSNAATNSNSGSGTSAGSAASGSSASGSSASSGSAASGSGASATSVGTVAPAADEVIVLGAEPLNLIQNGGFESSDTASVASGYVASTGATSSTSSSRAAMKSRLSTALNAVSYSTYNGQSNWCVVEVRDLQVQMSGNATSYAKALVEEVINENPDLFYAGAQYGAGTSTISNSSGSRTIITKILVQYYYTPSHIKSMKTTYETAIQNILKWVPANASDAEKAKAVHDWLVRNVAYATAAANRGGPSGYGSWDPWTAYGAAVNKYAVCEGYSLTFISAMARLGIQATFVTNANHGWNRVRLYDTQPGGSTYSYYWFNLDVTWDDPLMNGKDQGFSTKPATTYFLKSDNWFKKNQTGSNKEHAKWTPAGVAATNTKYDGGWSGGVYSGNASRGSVTSLKINPSAVTMPTDSTLTLTLDVAQNAQVVAGQTKWTSSNPTVAAVSSTGMVTSGKTNGSATITAELGGRKATCTVTVKSGVATLSSASVRLATSTSDLTYKSGVARKPALNVAVGGKTLKEGTDYSVTWPSDVVNPGVKTVTITGKGSYAGTTTFNYTITAQMSQTKRTAPSNPNPTYNGTAQKKAPTITFPGSAGKTLTLKEGTDYTITWPSNVTSAGTKTITITGKGAYKGTVTYTYKIQPLKISQASISYNSTVKYTGSAVTASPVVKMNGNTLKQGTDYTVTYKNNTRVGTATMVITGKNNTTGTVTKTFTIKASAASWSRLWGNSQYDTMQSIVKAGWKSTGGTVVIATGMGFQDALSAAGVAGLSNAPVLLVTRTSLPTQTRTELQRIRPTRVIIAGGPGAIKPAVANAIKSATGVTPQRIYGNSATDTAAALNTAFKGQWAENTAILATSKSFYDALSAAPVSYAKHYPIYLADNKNTISDTAIRSMKTCGIKRVIITGGTGAISNTVVNKLRSNGITVRERLWGNTQYDTSKAIAQWGVRNGMSANNMGVATSLSYYDALCGAALCGKNNAVLVLADKKNSNNVSFAKTNKSAISQAYIFGGKFAVSLDVENKLKTATK